MKKKIPYLIGLVLVITAGFVYCISGCKSKDSLQRDLIIETTMETQTSMDTTNICVYICGCVNSPGVYYFSAGSRVCEAVTAAGGFTENCNVTAINQAELMNDGQKIYFPSITEPINTQDKSNTLVNINTASAEELMNLPGIGEGRALSIIDYRDNKERFTSIEDIMKVSGIKESAFNKIKNLICV